MPAARTRSILVLLLKWTLFGLLGVALVVAKADRIINPDLERLYAKRAHSHTVEIDGASHSVYESHPKEVAALVEQAAMQAEH